MSTKNDVTGDSIISRSNTQQYRDNYDRIFYRGNHGLHKDITNEQDEESIETGTTNGLEGIEALECQEGC